MSATGLQKIDSGDNDALIDEVVRELTAISRTATLEVALQVGRVVFERVFHGDLRHLLYSGRGNVSFRAVAAHPDVPFSAASLWRSVGLYRLSLTFPELVRGDSLGVSHFRAVLGLPSDLQEELLQRAVNERWTKSTLEAAVASHRKCLKGRTGRRPTARPEKFVRKLAQTLDEIRAEPLDSGELSNWPAEALDDALRVLGDAIEYCNQLSTLIGTRKAGGTAGESAV